jgi:membrane fusion protein, macrolide-specific efflux system
MTKTVEFFQRHKIIFSITTITLLFLAIFFILRADSPLMEAEVRQGPIVEAIYGLAMVQTDQRHDVVLGAVNTVNQVFVEEGQRVDAGAPLVEMDLLEVFRAPFSGVVTHVGFRKNETVFPQQVVIRVEDLEETYLEVSLEQRAALRVEEGQSASVVFEEAGVGRIQGEVIFVYPRAGEFIARIQSSDLPEQVLPGMTADVAIEVDRKEGALIIPLAAVENGRVLRVRDGEQEGVPVQTGVIEGEWAEVVLGDLRVTDRVLLPEREGV